MKIAVDFDSTLADTLSVVLEFMNFKYGTALKAEDVTDWDWKVNAETWNKSGRFSVHFDPVEIDRDFWKVYDLFDSTHLRRTIPPVDPLACGAVKWLVKRGHKVEIVTSNRPAAEMSIRSWLFGHGLDLPLNMIGRKSPKEKAELDYDIYLDDSPKLAEVMPFTGKTLLLIPQPYNQYIEPSLNVWKTFSWRRAIDIFEELGL